LQRAASDGRRRQAGDDDDDEIGGDARGSAAAAAALAPVLGLRRCGVCGAVLSTPLHMQEHLEGKRHCEAVARRAAPELTCAPPTGAAGAAAVASF
jgi:hypothetical protein